MTPAYRDLPTRYDEEVLEHESRLADELAERLRAASIDAQVTDRRYVRAAVGDRELKIFCIWYERAVGALMLGMNPANARRSLGRAARPREGAEYLVELREHGAALTADRTSDAEQVVACAFAWLARHCFLDEIEHETPFVRALYRRASALVATLDPSLRTSIGGDPSYEVWAYGDGRSCKLVHGSCAFWFGQSQIAFAELQDPAPAVSAWLVERVSIAELAKRSPEIAVEAHAKWLERDPARWHWLHLLERAANPDDVLVPLRDLIEALATRPAVAAFYSYSSLIRLCFSASSHYPWVDDGLPIVWRERDGYLIRTYQGVILEPAICDLEHAVASIERRLAAYEVRPFFGSMPHHQLEPLARALAERGSTLRPAVVQHGEWFRLEVTSGDRRCELSGDWVSLTERGETRRLEVPTLDDAAAVIIGFLEP